MKKLFVSLVIVCLSSMLVMAQNTAPAPVAPPSNLPDVVVNGFREFLSAGYSAATNTWTLNSPLSLDGTTLTSINNTFLQESNLAGNFIGADLLRTVSFSGSTQEVYAMAKYQRGVLFMSFTCYRPSSNDKWLVTMLSVDKDPSKILPTNIMGGL